MRDGGTGRHGDGETRGRGGTRRDTETLRRGGAEAREDEHTRERKKDISKQFRQQALVTDVT
jgi:hypothetical protein